MGESADQRFLAGLRQRNLFELAEGYCARRLAEADLPPARRAELVIEWSLSLAEHAVNSPPDRRGPLWDQASAVIQRFVSQHPASPFLLQVRFQGALTVLARGELARQEAEVVAGDRASLQRDARRWLREAVRQLAGLLEEVRQAERQFSIPGRQPRGLGQRELVSLDRHIQFQLARAYRNQGQSYPPASADRANSLSAALELLEELAALEITHPLAWKSRIDQIVCLRLLGDVDRARERLQSLAKLDAPPEIALWARAEGLLLALATERWEEVGAIMDQGRQIAGTTSPYLDYAWLKACLEGWHAATAAGQQHRADKLQDEARGLIARIRASYGPYWIRRAQMLMAGHVAQVPESTDLEMWVQAAENAFRSGQFDQALASYDRARALAEGQGDRNRAFQLAYTAAAIQHQRGRHAEALDRYRQLALAMPDHPRAPETHWLAVLHAARLVRGRQPDAAQQYVSLLKENINRWPDTAAADRARWHLGQWYEHQRRWADAVKAYRAISPRAPELAAAVQAAGQCYQRWLAERAQAGQPTAQMAAEGAEWFESLVSHAGQPATARQAALAAARLRLQYDPTGHARAEQLLAATLARSPHAPPPWKAAVRALLVSALAVQGKYAQATKVLAQLSADPPDGLLAALESLAELSAGAAPAARTELARLQLEALRLLAAREHELTSPQRSTLSRIRAQALADVGRIDQALGAYEELVEANPQDLELQELYARLLASRSDRASLQAALERWRRIARQTPTATPRWFRAKYALAELHYRMGQSDTSQAIIRQLRVLHPELGGPSMKERFQELLQRCKTQRPR